MQTPPKSSPNKSMSNNVSSLDMTNVINQVISKQEAQNGSITSDNENNDNITNSSGNIQLKIEDVAKILESGQKGSVIISKEDISKLFSSTLSNSQNNNRSDNQKETNHSYSSSQKILDELNADSPTSHSMFPTLTPMESHVENQDPNDPNQNNNNSDWSFEEQFKPLYQIDNDPLRKPFLNDLFAFMHQKGQPINRIPIMAKQILDLYTLYKLVVSKGGLVEVIQKKIWREITKGLNLPNSITSAAFTLRTQYMKYLYPYECAKEKLSNDSELNSAIEGNKRDNKVGKSVSYPHHGQSHESYDTNISFHHKNSTPSHNYHNDSGISERSFHNRHNLQSNSNLNNNNDRKNHFPPLEKFTPIATPSSSGNMIIDRIDQNDSLNHLKNVLGLTTNNQSTGSSSHKQICNNSVNQISPGKVSLSPSTLENLSTVAAAVLCATQSKNSDRALTSDNLVAFEALAKLKRSVNKSNENTNNQSNLTSPTSRIAPIQNNNHHNNLKRKIENDYTEKTSKLLKIANNQSNSTNNSDSVYNENNHQLTQLSPAPSNNNFNFNFSDLSNNKSITATITINGVVYEGELKPKNEEGEQNLNQTQIIAKQLLLENLKK